MHIQINFFFCIFIINQSSFKAHYSTGNSSHLRMRFPKNIIKIVSKKREAIIVALCPRQSTKRKATVDDQIAAAKKADLIHLNILKYTSIMQYKFLQLFLHRFLRRNLKAELIPLHIQSELCYFEYQIISMFIKMQQIQDHEPSLSQKRIKNSLFLKLNSE